MIDNKTVAVVVPCYNEEIQIGMVIETMPDFVDRIIIVNDKSKDNTEKVVLDYIARFGKSSLLIDEIIGKTPKTRYNTAEIVLEEQMVEERKFFTPSKIMNDDYENQRIILVNHLENGGVGAAIATGYKWAKDHGIDCTAVMAGDGQMDPDELLDICSPVIKENIDYVKGNRLIHRSANIVIPKVRFFGNSVLSMLTKIASGYWHVSDTQTGYTALSKKGLHSIKLYEIYKRYGMPNDMLVKLNIAMCTLREIEIKPVYNVGEKSKMNIKKVILTVPLLLLKSFFKRLWQKYLYRDFHPLFLLYHYSFLALILTIPYAFKILLSFVNGTTLNYEPLLAFIFLFTSGFQSLLFAMWMDIQDNERLYMN